MNRVRSALEPRAEAAGMTLTIGGAAADWDVESGLEFLERFGTFDEVVAGKRWTNLALVQYAWRGEPGTGAVPQMLFVTRDVELDGNVIYVGPDRLLARKVGLGELWDWEQAGFPLHLPVVNPVDAEPAGPA